MKMNKTRKYEDMSVIEAQYEAQKIAFAPFVFQISMALKELKVLETLNPVLDAGMSFEVLKEKLPLSEYALNVLLESGVSAGIILHDGENYALSKIGYFLNSDEMTLVNMNFTQDVCYDGLKNLTDSFLSGKPEGLKVFGNWNTIYEGLTTLPEKTQKSWYEFDHYYSDLAFDNVLAVVFKEKPKKILDFGGNTGRFTKKCISYSNDCSITIFDHPTQLEKAKSNFNDEERKRVNFQGIDFLNIGESESLKADFVWMSQFLDCFSEEEVINVIRFAAKNLNENGEIFILETCVDRQKFEAASFSLAQTSVYFTCMANGNSKMFMSDKLISMIEKSGFKVTEIIDCVGGFHTLFCCRLV